jgi:hypothetical protein
VRTLRPTFTYLSEASQDGEPERCIDIDGSTEFRTRRAPRDPGSDKNDHRRDRLQGGPIIAANYTARLSAIEKATRRNDVIPAPTIMISSRTRIV